MLLVLMSSSEHSLARLDAFNDTTILIGRKEKNTITRHDRVSCVSSNRSNDTPNRTFEMNPGKGLTGVGLNGTLS